MDLPVAPPVQPMLARNRSTLPTGQQWWYEPKFDGFRCLVFRAGDELQLWSRGGKPFDRYFPELRAPLLAQLPERCVVDGELVVQVDGRLDFDALGQRIHPAASRVDMLAEETPASFVAFDLLALADADLRGAGFSRRRDRLVSALAGATPPVVVTPITRDPEQARDWFARFEGAGLDGVVAKDGDDPYVEGQRQLVKLKHQRTADVVVAGYRTHKSGDGVGSLLLGLYGEHGRLHHVGVASSFSADRRAALVDELAPLEDVEPSEHPWASWADAEAHDEGRRLPGVPSRWSAGAAASAWVPLRIERVAEVGFNQLTQGRLRHPARLVRWRPDREPRSCTYDQLQVAPPAELSELLGTR